MKPKAYLLFCSFLGLLVIFSFGEHRYKTKGGDEILAAMDFDFDLEDFDFEPDEFFPDKESYLRNCKVTLKNNLMMMAGQMNEQFQYSRYAQLTAWFGNCGSIIKNGTEIKEIKNIRKFWADQFQEKYDAAGGNRHNLAVKFSAVSIQISRIEKQVILRGKKEIPVDLTATIYGKLVITASTHTKSEPIANQTVNCELIWDHDGICGWFLRWVCY